MAGGALAVVEEWLEAVNNADGLRLEQLTTPVVEISGPRGSGPTERAVLSGWLQRAGFSSRALRWFCGSDGSVVVEQAAQWVDVESGAKQDRVVLASQFRVDGAQVSAYTRHADLASALQAAGLNGADMVTERRSQGYPPPARPTISRSIQSGAGMTTTPKGTHPLGSG